MARSRAGQLGLGRLGCGRAGVTFLPAPIRLAVYCVGIVQYEVLSGGKLCLDHLDETETPAIQKALHRSSLLDRIFYFDEHRPDSQLTGTRVAAAFHSP